MKFYRISPPFAETHSFVKALSESAALEKVANSQSFQSASDLASELDEKLIAKEIPVNYVNAINTINLKTKDILAELVTNKAPWLPDQETIDALKIAILLCGETDPRRAANVVSYEMSQKGAPYGDWSNIFLKNLALEILK